MEIADLEDECLTKVREMAFDNYQRINRMLDEGKAKN